MSDEEGSMSGSDLEVEDVTEGADIKVVQSSMHASIMQNSLFKVIEKQKESENESEEDKNEPQIENLAQDQLVNAQKNDEPVAETKEIEKIEENIIEDTNKNMEVEVNSNPVSEEIPKSPEKKYSKAITKILTDKEPEKPHKIDVDKRFYEYQSKVSKKIENLKEEYQKKELEDCTFAPKTNNKAEKRKFDQFLHHVANFEKVKKERLDRQRKEKEENECSQNVLFRPSLSEKTLKLTSGGKKPNVIYERLYKESKVMKEKQESLAKQILDEQCSFKPKLNKQSETLMRDGKASERLFEISKKKKIQENNDKNQEKNDEKLVNPESESIMTEKFVKELTDSFPVRAPDAEKSMNFQEFLGFLEKLHFIPESSHPKFSNFKDLSEKAWQSLEGTESTSVLFEKIQDFLMSIQNFSNVSPQKNLHLDYLLFYQFRKNFKKPIETSSSAPFLFKPSLYARSEKLAAEAMRKRSANIGNSTIENVLIIEHQKFREKMQAKIKAKENYFPEECTFTPKINRGPQFSQEEFKDYMSLGSDYLKLSLEGFTSRNELLYNFSKVEIERKEKLERNVEEMEFEKNMNDCCFVPNTDKPKIDFRNAQETKGFSKTVERISKVREENEKNQKTEFAPMKFGIDQKPRIPKDEKKGKIPSKKVKKIENEVENPDFSELSFKESI